MTHPLRPLIGFVILGSIMSSESLAASRSNRVTGRDAVAVVRHDWKKTVHKTVHASATSRLALPANFAKLSPEARLTFLHDRRNLAPTRFDLYHPNLGRLLAADDRMRAAQSQDCRPMNGILPNTPHTRYLQHRRSLNPARFDLYHPTLGALLVEDQKLKSGAFCLGGELIPPVVVVPPTGGTPSPNPPVGGGGGGILPVPEPGSLSLMAIGGAAALTIRTIRKRRNRGPLLG